MLHSSGVSRDEATKIFNGIDQDHTDHISYTEFLAASINRRLWLSRERIRDAFSRLDVDGTGYITRDNLKALLGDEWTADKVETMMSEADTKGDGRIDFDEFVAVMSNAALADHAEPDSDASSAAAFPSSAPAPSPQPIASLPYGKGAAGPATASLTVAVPQATRGREALPQSSDQRAAAATVNGGSLASGPSAGGSPQSQRRGAGGRGGVPVSPVASASTATAAFNMRFPDGGKSYFPESPTAVPLRGSDQVAAVRRRGAVRPGGLLRDDESDGEVARGRGGTAGTAGGLREDTDDSAADMEGGASEHLMQIDGVLRRAAGTRASLGARGNSSSSSAATAGDDTGSSPPLSMGRRSGVPPLALALEAASVDGLDIHGSEDLSGRMPLQGDASFTTSAARVTAAVAGGSPGRPPPGVRPVRASSSGTTAAGVVVLPGLAVRLRGGSSHSGGPAVNPNPPSSSSSLSSVSQSPLAASAAAGGGAGTGGTLSATDSVGRGGGVAVRGPGDADMMNPMTPVRQDSSSDMQDKASLLMRNPPALRDGIRNVEA